MEEKIKLTESDFKSKLDPESFKVLRQKGTEKPFSGKYNDFWESGKYSCKACGNPLFKSETKFDAGCGWPSFYEASSKSAVSLKPDYSHFMIRTEVLCSKCNSHLGHVFDDGPQPTNQRYCINSVCLDFEKNEDL